MIKKFPNKLQLFKKLVSIIKNNKEPLLISGGNTIKELFKNLNTKITNIILLSDERLVKSNSKIRNSYFFERMIRKKYILKKNFIYYKSSKVNYKELESINRRIKKIKFKFAWAFKSKINLSFGSTMILELNGNGKEAFFIDPDGLNHQWFHGIKDLEKYRIQNYESLKEIVENCNIEKNNSSSQNNSFLCLKRDNTSNVIAEILKEAKI